MWLIILIIAVVVFFYFTGIKPMNYWERQGVPNVKPVPYLGNFSDFVLRKRAASYVIDDIYHAFPKRRYCGLYNFGTPTLMIRDPDLLKTITVREFETFPEHRDFFSKDSDPLWSKNLLAMRGDQKWHDMRSTLSPSFTSSKMKMMFELIKTCSRQFSDHFRKENTLVTVELKDAFIRFTNDVIATTAFGITCDSLENRNNEFFTMGRKISTFTGLRNLLFPLYFVSPTLSKLINIPIFPPDARGFFRNVISRTIKLREEQGVVRLDMIHLMMEARKGRSKVDEKNDEALGTGFATVQESEVGKSTKRKQIEMTDEDITAQALVFFIAGFDTVSTMLCFACYELALNPDIQERLYSEISEAFDSCQENVNYETLMKMKYLDAVIAETLRKWPPFISTDRRSVKPFTIQPEQPDEQPLHLPKHTICFIPIFSIQRDPEYYPDPDRFDPERFNDENKSKINPFTYLPFGFGPRNCIGSRFALLEGKLVLAEILSKFEIVPVEKTEVPIQLSKKSFFPMTDNGFWVGLKPRGANVF